MKHYVYSLIDPRDGQPFYIGKGQGKRMHDHAKATRSGYDCNQLKIERIQDIHAAGLEVITNKIAEFDSAAEALALEAQLIAGSDDLTNARGGGPNTGWSRAELKRRCGRAKAHRHSERGRAIQSLRVAADLTQEEAAAILGITRQAWARYEMGMRPMKAWKLDAWLHLAGLKEMPFKSRLMLK